MKFKTVLEGQEAVILNYLGEGRLVKGPQRVCITKISFIIIKGFLSQFQISVLSFRNILIKKRPTLGTLLFV